MKSPHQSLLPLPSPPRTGPAVVVGRWCISNDIDYIMTRWSLWGGGGCRTSHLVLGLGGDPQLSIGRYDVHRHQVIACQTEQPRQVAHSATQRETCHTRVAHDALKCGGKMVGTSQKRKRGGVQAKRGNAYPPARSSQRPTIRRRRHPGGIQHRHAPPCSPRPPGCLASTSTGQATPPTRTRTHALGGGGTRCVIQKIAHAP